MQIRKGRNGGLLTSQSVGDKGLPGAGRTVAPFKQHIRALAEGGVVTMDFDGWLLDADDKKTGELVRVRIDMPSALAVVVKMYKKAVKGDVGAARWLNETGYGKTLKFEDEDGNPMGAGFAMVLLPDNGRK